MKCKIEWVEVQRPEEYRRVRRSTLLQYAPYGRALSVLNRQDVRHAVIWIDGKRAGLAQLLDHKALGGALQAVMLDRGPLWFDGFGSREHFAAFTKTLSEAFPRRIGRRRRFIPEIDDSPENREVLLENGFRAVGGAPYRTITLDLARSLTDLEADLHSKWRNILRKSRKSGLSVTWDRRGKSLPLFLKKYDMDRRQKGYDGPSVLLLRKLAEYLVPTDEFLIGMALINNKPVAGILVVCHGTGATYQVGWTSEKGRDTAAHYLLLWESLTVLKDKGIKDFDLGGINDAAAKGVKRFKERMGGTLVSLAGLYI